MNKYELRRQFKKETGSLAIIKEQPHKYYSAWLEQRIESGQDDDGVMQEIVDALIEYDRRFYNDHKFDSSPQGGAVSRGREILKKMGVETEA